MRIREGMVVYGSDGRKVGKVLACDRATFLVEKGLWRKRDLVARYEDVAEISGDEVRLSRRGDELGVTARVGPGLPLGDPSASLGPSAGAEMLPSGPDVEVRTSGDEELEERARRSRDEGERVFYNMGEDPGALGAHRGDGDD
jgi:hypothetical protein